MCGIIGVLTQENNAREIVVHWVRYIGNTSGIIIAKQYLEVIDGQISL